MHKILKMSGLGEDSKWEIVGSTSSLEKIFTDATLLLNQVGQINLHYTCHHVLPSSQRDFSSGEWLFFDIDGISDFSTDLVSKYQCLLANIFNLEAKYLWGISSGNGVHLLIKIKPYELAYLEVHKSTYNKIATEFEAAIRGAGLTGKLDRVFQRSKSLRLPNTVNRKKDQSDKRCEILYSGEALDLDILTTYRQTYDSTFDLELETKKMAMVLTNSHKSYALPEVIQKAGLNVNNIASKDEILRKCTFLAKFPENLAYLPREEWLRGISLLTTLGMESEAHEWSNLSPTYKQSETEEIIQSTKGKNFSPTSCKKIVETFNADLTEGCGTCSYKTCKTPAKLFDDETLMSMAQGFQSWEENAKGELVNKGVNYLELGRFCHKYLNTFMVTEHEAVYAWNYEEDIYERQSIFAMAKRFNDLIVPTPKDPTMTKTKGLDSMQINHSLKEKDILPPEGLIPLKNGWLNALNGTLEPYTPKYLVTQKIPVEFNPVAECPLFLQFLKDRVGDEETIDVLLQYVCYALAGIKYPNRKILVLEGPKGTGKTTLMTVLAQLFGHLYNMGNLQHLAGRFETASFENKRLIIFDEAPTQKDSNLVEVLKTLSGSPYIRIEKKNENAVTVQNLARLIIACNTIPQGGAMDSGFMDRLLIVPMHNQIENHEQSGLAVDAIQAELSGILNLVLSKYPKLRQQNFHISNTAVTEAQADKYQEESDPVANFIIDTFDFVACPSDTFTYLDKSCYFGSDETVVTLKNFREAFKSWAAENSPYWASMSAMEIRKRLDFLLKSLFKGKGKIIPSSRGKIYITGLRFIDRTLLHTQASTQGERF